MKVAWIGLGTMGAPMARRLLDAGHPLTVHNRSREREAALVLARRLRRRFSVDVDLLERGVAGQMKAANRLGARVTVVVGEGERARGEWTVKNMASGEQVAVTDAGLEEHLDTLFARA